ANTGGEGQLPLLSVFGADIAAQDEYAFIMGLAAELRLPLNVHDPAPAYECLGGDPRWLAKAEITHLINRQAIDLPHNRLVDIHKNNSVSNELLEPLLDKIQPRSLLDDSSLDMLCGHQCGFVFPGPIVRLDQ